MPSETQDLKKDRRLPLSSDLRVFIFSTMLAAVAAVLYLQVLDGRHDLDRPFQFPFLVLVGLFLGAEMFVVHIDLRGHALSASLTEIPLVLGLYFVPPGNLIAAYVVGAGVALLMHRKQQPLKLYFNLCQLAVQACVVAILFYAILGGSNPIEVRGWVAVIVATVLTDALAALMIAAVMSLADGRLRWDPKLFWVGMVAGFSNAALALTAGTILWARFQAAWLMLIPAALLFLAYRAYAHQRHKRESIERLYDSTRAMQTSLGEESVADALLEQAREMIGAQVAELIIFPAPGEEFAQRTVLGPGDKRRSHGLKLEATEGVWARVASDGQGMLILPPIKNERLRAYMSSEGLTDAIVAPLGGKDAIAGTLLVANHKGDVGGFDDQDLKMLETLAAHASMSLEKGRLLDSLRDQAEANEFLAKHDPLTGLFNRSHFLEGVATSIETAKLSDGLAAVLLMDLDRFKEINDTLGHQVGDSVLVEFARRLEALLPDGVAMARTGGDEFAILLSHISDASQARAEAARIVEMMKEPIRLEDATLDVQGSIGVALYPIHARDANGLLQRADVAMYLAKDARTGFEVYGVERDQYTHGRLALVGELRQALERDELVVFYQPKISLETGVVEGIEALVRWDHPRKGLIPPNDFIPLAEHTGLIKPLTFFVLRRAIQDIQRWREIEPDLHVAVNLSVRSLADGDICHQVAAILDEYDAPRGCLELEITESSIMDDPQGATWALTRMSEMGITLAIDDFGTGYSSLSYLKRLPVDSLKVDKSFVLGMESDENDAIIVRSIIDLGRNLGLKVVAEGVESPKVIAALKAMGCHAAQGYSISRPLPGEKLAPWLIAHAAVRSGGESGKVAHFRTASGD